MAVASLAVIGVAALVLPSFARAAHPEEARVVKEACGEKPDPACVARLKKVCRSNVTLRCYYARKRRIDGTDHPDSPEKADERDDRSIFYDE